MDPKEQSPLDELIRKWDAWIHHTHVSQMYKHSGVPLSRVNGYDLYRLQDILTGEFTCDDDKDFIREVAIGTGTNISRYSDNMLFLAGWHLASAVYGWMNGVDYDGDVTEAGNLIRAHELEVIAARKKTAIHEIERSAQTLMSIHPDRSTDIYDATKKLLDLVNR